MREKSLIDVLKLCFSDWDGDFDVDVEQEDDDGDFQYFSCIIQHSRIGREYSFSARVDGSGHCCMETSEEVWEFISPAIVFCSMWFDLAEARN